MSTKIKNKNKKVHALIERYRDILKTNLLNTELYYGSVLMGFKSKMQILDFFVKNNRWPSRLAKTKREKRLACRFENMVSKKSGSYDKNMRRVAFAAGRKTNKKRDHNVDQNKQEILNFLAEHGRVPSTSYKYQLVAGEACLRHKLDYYTKTKNDMTLLSKVYAVDKCHKSGIPTKYRQLINESLDVKKPLIRLV